MSLDARVLAELKKMRREGHDRASVKQLMERIKGQGDSVKYLGALERVKGAYRKWVNGLSR